MAPPEHPFPVSELEQRIQFKTVNFKEKSRKLGDFDLKRDCELFELVQYTCTTEEQQRAAMKNTGNPRIDCYPFVRLFRRCGTGKRMFHVETTAWEGQHAWKPPRTASHSAKTKEMVEPDTKSSFASLWNYFWPEK